MNQAHDAVEVWSTQRLRFEPRGWLLDLRTDLRSALAQMRPCDGAMLNAVYSSRVDAFCDVENVLIYNVGASKLRVDGQHRLAAGARLPLPAGAA